MAIGAIATAGATIISSTASFFDKSVAGPCPGSPPVVAVQRAFAAASAADLAEFDRRASAVGHSWRSMSPEVLIKHAMGGDDCRIGTANGRLFAEQFWHIVNKYGTQDTPTYSTATSYEGETVSSETDRLKYHLGALAGDLWATGKNVVTGLATEGIPGARAAAAGGRAGSTAGAKIAGVNTNTLVVVAAVIVAIILLRR